MIQYIKEENTIKVKLLPCPIVIKGGDGEQSDWLEEDTESLAYIKNKPTNVSSFNNDVGYLTEHQDLSDYAKTSDLSPVALSDDYDDLQNKPTIPIVNDATITLTQGGTVKGSFTLNQSGDHTIDVIITSTGTSTNWFYKVNGTWREVDKIFFKRGSSWTQVDKMFTKINGNWENR